MNVLVGERLRGRLSICVGFALLVVACGTGPVDSDGQQASAPSMDAAPEGMPGEYVAERSTVIALDPSTGHERWQGRPPLLNARPIQEIAGTLNLEGNVSRTKCSFLYASTKLDVASGAFIAAEVHTGPRTLAEGMPPINDGQLSIRYVLDPLADQLSTGLEAIDTTTGSTLWSKVQPGPNGRAVYSPPVFGSGVLAATVGGRNPEFTGPATAIEFIDEQTGEILWAASGDPAVAIGGGIAYVLNLGSLEAHDIRTGRSRWRQDSEATQLSANDHVVVVSGDRGRWHTTRPGSSCGRCLTGSEAEASTAVGYSSGATRSSSLPHRAATRHRALVADTRSSRNGSLQNCMAAAEAVESRTCLLTRASF